MTEDNNRELFKQVNDIWDIDDNDDIDYEGIHKKGEVTVNQKRWNVITDATDDTIVTVDMVIEFKYAINYDDDSNSKYVRVQATLSDFRDSGITGNPDVTILSVDKVNKDFVLP